MIPTGNCYVYGPRLNLKGVYFTNSAKVERDSTDLLELRGDYEELLEGDSFLEDVECPVEDALPSGSGHMVIIR